VLILGSDTIEVKDTTQKGRGVFAKNDLPGGTVIADYLGKIILPEEEDETEQSGVYGMCWRGDFSILPDLTLQGAHTVNHSCMPNASYYPYHGHILIVATRKIFSGEEITTSYLIDPESCSESPCHHQCYCDTPVCTGTMHSSHQISGPGWEKFVREKQGDFFNSDFPIGSRIQKLEAYPEFMPDDNYLPIYGNVFQPPLEIELSVCPPFWSIRQHIRISGKTLNVRKLHLHILGITPNGHMIATE
jgi:hypothetical protein